MRTHDENSVPGDPGIGKKTCHCCRQCKTIQSLDDIFQVTPPQQFQRRLLEILFIALESTRFDGMDTTERTRLTGTIEQAVDVFECLTINN